MILGNGLFMPTPPPRGKKVAGCQTQTLVQDPGDQDAFLALSSPESTGTLSVNSSSYLNWGSERLLLLADKNIWPKTSNSKVDEQPEQLFCNEENKHRKYMLPHLKNKEVQWKHYEFLLLPIRLAKIKILYPDLVNRISTFLWEFIFGL